MALPMATRPRRSTLSFPTETMHRGKRNRSCTPAPAPLHADVSVGGALRWRRWRGMIAQELSRGCGEEEAMGED
jgi:hypothetical protein